MKKIINLIIENLKLKIETKKILKNNLENMYKLLNTFAELHVEYESVLEKVKKTNFKEAYLVQNDLYNELLKENKKLRKEGKEYEKTKQN